MHKSKDIGVLILDKEDWLKDESGPGDAGGRGSGFGYGCGSGLPMRWGLFYNCYGSGCGLLWHGAGECWWNSGHIL